MKTSQVIANRYKINNLTDDLLGRGGMGYVYRGVDAQTGLLVAIKELRPDLTVDNDKAVKRFMQEGEILRQLNHPNIVSMLANVVENDHHYLIMEYVGGGSLEDLLEKEIQLPLTRVVDIALDLVDALTHTHRLNIIHRDLKPGNILLTETGTPRLTDFGIARIQHTNNKLTQRGDIMGTMAYLSPEACRAESLDKRTDIWSLGVVMYEMLTGLLPFDDKSLVATMHAILNQPVFDLQRLCPDLPEAMADLVYRCLEKNRHQRIPSMRLVGAELESIFQKYGNQHQHTSPVLSNFNPTTFTSDKTSDALSSTLNHNLPSQTTPFIGRTEELATLDRLLMQPNTHLLTIVGAGGMGKTRLALEVAHIQRHNFRHGVYFIALAPLNTKAGIVDAIAKAIGFSFHQQGQPQQQLLDYLASQHMLLVMDNFEHLLIGVGLVGKILAAAPKMKIMATSREPLKLTQEQIFPLTGLDTNLVQWETIAEAKRYSSVQLFLQNARRTQPKFTLTPEDLPALFNICQLIQGTPLGLILASAWIEVLTLAEIATEIKQNLDFLETDVHDVPTRHQSMRAVFDYSWDRLTESEQQILPQLAVFRDGFLREAVQQITGISLRQLMTFINKSLLHRTPDGRYQIHELLRQYLAQKLAQSPTLSEVVCQKQATYYLNFLKDRDDNLHGRHQRRALREIEVEYENIKAAWNWGLKEEWITQLLDVLDSLGFFYQWNLRDQEGLQTCTESVKTLNALNTPSSPLTSDTLRLIIRLQTWQSLFSKNLEDIQTAHQRLNHNLTLLDQPILAEEDTRFERAFVWQVQGSLANITDGEQAQKLYQQSLDLYQTLGKQWHVAYLLHRLGSLIRQPYAIAESKALLEQSLLIRQQLGDQAGIASTLNSLGLTIWLQGQTADATSLMKQSNTIYQETGDRVGIVDGHLDLALVLLHAGEYEQATSEIEAGLTLAQENGYQWMVDDALNLWSERKLVAEAYQEIEDLYQKDAYVLSIHHQYLKSRALALLGYTACALANVPLAKQRLMMSLQIAISLQSKIGLVFTLVAIARLLIAMDEPEDAIALYSFCSAYPFIINSRWVKDVAGQYLAVARSTLPAEVVTAAQERGQQYDLFGIARKLLDILMR